MKLAKKARARAAVTAAAAAKAKEDAEGQFAKQEDIKKREELEKEARKAKAEAESAAAAALKKAQEANKKAEVLKAVKRSKFPVHTRLVQRFSDQVVIRVQSFRREQADFEMLKAENEEDDDMEALLDILRTEFLIENGREPTEEELEEMILEDM